MIRKKKEKEDSRETVRVEGTLIGRILMFVVGFIVVELVLSFVLLALVVEIFGIRNVGMDDVLSFYTFQFAITIIMHLVIVYTTSRLVVMKMFKRKYLYKDNKKVFLVCMRVFFVVMAIWTLFRMPVVDEASIRSAIDNPDVASIFVIEEEIMEQIELASRGVNVLLAVAYLVFIPITKKFVEKYNKGEEEGSSTENDETPLENERQL